MEGKRGSRKDIISAQVVFSYKMGCPTAWSAASLHFVINYFSKICCLQFPPHLEKKGVAVAFANLTRNRSREHDCGQKAQLTENTAQCRVGFTYYLLALICTPFGQVAKLLKNQTKRGDAK